MKVSPCFFMGLALGFLASEYYKNKSFSVLPYQGQTGQTPPQVGAYYTDYARHPGSKRPCFGSCAIPPINYHQTA